MPVTTKHSSDPKDSCLKRSSDQGVQSQVKVARTLSKSDVHHKVKAPVQDDGDIFGSKDSVVGNAQVPSVVGRPCSVSPLLGDMDWSCVSPLRHPMHMDLLDDSSHHSSASASPQQLMNYFQHPIFQHELTPLPSLYSSSSSLSIGSFDCSCIASLGGSFRSNFSLDSGYNQYLNHSSNSMEGNHYQEGDTLIKRP